MPPISDLRYVGKERMVYLLILLLILSPQRQSLFVLCRLQARIQAPLRVYFVIQPGGSAAEQAVHDWKVVRSDLDHWWTQTRLMKQVPPSEEVNIGCPLD